MAIRAFLDPTSAKQVEDALREMGSEAGRVMAAAMEAGIEIMLDAAESNAPWSDEMVIETKEKSGNKVEMNAGPDKKRWYAHFFEFGTQEHLVRPDRRQALSFDDWIVAGATAGGITQRPFMRPAFDSKSNEAIDKMGAELKRRLGL